MIKVRQIIMKMRRQKKKPTLNERISARLTQLGIKEKPKPMTPDEMSKVASKIIKEIKASKLAEGSL